MFVHLSMYLFFFFFYLHHHYSIYLFIYISIYFFIYSPICLFIQLFVCLGFVFVVCLCLFFIVLFCFCLFVCLFVCFVFYSASRCTCLRVRSFLSSLCSLLYLSVYYNDNNNNSNHHHHHHHHNHNHHHHHHHHHHHRIQRRNSRFSTISSLRRELSPARTLKWLGRNCVEITCNTSNAYHVHHVVLRATWHEGTAQLLILTDYKSHLFELYFIG